MSKVYGIEVKETFSKVVYIKAESKEQAMSFAEMEYANCGIAINNDDFLEGELNHWDDGEDDDCYDFDATEGAC